MVDTPAIAGSGSVIMLYGLAGGKMVCDHIFNLLCSYGNVLKVGVAAIRRMSPTVMVNVT